MAFMVLILFIIGAIAIAILGLAASGSSAIKGTRRSYPAPVDRRGLRRDASGPKPPSD
jgi:hypothetical protein